MSRLPALALSVVLLATPTLVGCAEQEEPAAGPSGPSRAASGPTEGSGTADALPAELAIALEDRPREATRPRQVARQIRAAEDAIGDRRTSVDMLAAAGHLQQVAYRTLAEHPRWDARVRRLLPRRLHRVVRENVASKREFRAMHPSRHRDLADHLPAWRIVRPEPRAELRRLYGKAQRRFGVDWSYLAAINLVETQLGRIRGTSSAGAQGPMQFMPGTWDIYGQGDVHDPHDAIMAAGRFLRAHGFTRPGGKAGALFRYNNSARYVRGVTLLAELMARRPRAWAGYYHWRVYYLTQRGSILLPVGYRSREPVPVEEWLAEHPQ